MALLKMCYEKWREVRASALEMEPRVADSESKFPSLVKGTVEIFDMNALRQSHWNKGTQTCHEYVIVTQWRDSK